MTQAQPENIFHLPKFSEIYMQIIQDKVIQIYEYIYLKDVI